MGRPHPFTEMALDLSLPLRIFFAARRKSTKLSGDIPSSMQSFSRFYPSHALFLTGLLAVCHTGFGQASSFATKEGVGRVGTNRISTPVNQVLTPEGIQVELPGH